MTICVCKFNELYNMCQFKFIFIHSKRFKSSGTDSLKRYRRRILPLKDLEGNSLNNCGLTQQIKQVDISNFGSNNSNSGVKSVLKLK